MKQQVNESWRFLRTTAIGGLLFLLPLAVIGGILGYVYSLVIVIYEPLKEMIPVSTASGIAILFLMALGILICLCFLAGIAARRAFARRFTKTVERQLTMMFPKYAIYKDILAGNIGGDSATPSLKPIRIELQDRIQIGYESGRTEDGLVIVFLPGAPDPWNGSVAMVKPEQVSPLEVDFNETAAICERMGRDSEKLLKS
ncbi:MAG: hypothetical protein P8M30_02020 [Planctomycetaceae bacterium]|jgi:uncharacterized membrane protein|nr:hypothetical protein [Planctomycetaceae bacterium]